MLQTWRGKKKATQELLVNQIILVVFGRTLASHTEPLLQIIVFPRFLLAVYPCFQSERSCFIRMSESHCYMPVPTTNREQDHSSEWHRKGVLCAVLQMMWSCASKMRRERQRGQLLYELPEVEAASPIGPSGASLL